MKETEVKDLMNEGVVEMTNEVSSTGSVMPKVIIAGTIVAVGVAAVMYVRKRRAKKLAEIETEEVETVITKSEK